MDYYAEYKSNLTHTKWEDIFFLKKEVSLNKEVVQTICNQFVNFENDIKDLIIFLRNNIGLSPIEVIQYLKYLFDMPLNKASVLYQEYTPEKSDTQFKFKLNKDILLPQENILSNAMEILKTLKNPICTKIIVFIHKKQTTDAKEISTSLNLTSSTILNYLRKMKKINLIISQKDGKHIYYSLNHTNFDRILDLIKKITEPKELVGSI